MGEFSKQLLHEHIEVYTNSVSLKILNKSTYQNERYLYDQKV